MGSLRGVVWAVGTILDSMAVSVRGLFRKPVTLQYPQEKFVLPPRARAQLHVNIDDCIGCDQCARACPVDCIYIDTVKAPASEDLGKTATGHRKKLWVTRFDIDMGKCCYCALCTYPCPTECIFMTRSYENAVYDRSDLVYHYSTISPEQAAVYREVAAKAEAEEAAAKAAAAKAKAEAAAKAKGEAPTPPAAGSGGPETSPAEPGAAS